MRTSSTRAFSKLVLALGLLTIGIPPAVGDQILEIYNNTLTNYLPGATIGQKVSPTTRQRGVGVDGSLRSPSLFGWSLAGNPFEGTGGGKLGALWLDTGAVGITDVDIALPADVPWPVGRSFNGVQVVAATHSDSNGPQGYNWFQMSMPELVRVEGSTDADDTLWIVYGADRYVEFQRKNSTSNDFKGKNGAAGMVHYDSGTTPDTYIYHDQHNNQIFFLGFDTSGHNYDGQIWKIVDPAGSVAYVGDDSDPATAITDGYDSSLYLVKTAYDSAHRRFSYTYSASNIPSTGAGARKRLESVVAEVEDTNDWDTPDNITEVARVAYSYYSADADSYGLGGDLKRVTITTPLTDPDTSLVRETYYRYWDNNAGKNHMIQYIVGPEGTRRYDWLDQDFGVDGNDNDFETASESDLKPYADAYFDYTSYQVTTAWFNGECGCGGGINGQYSITYSPRSGFSDGTGYDTETVNSLVQAEWARRTIVLQPDPDSGDGTDNNYVTYYFDELGQPLSNVFSDGDPAGSPNFWVNKIVRDSGGRVTIIHSPESVTGYTHSSGAYTLASGAGLVSVRTRVSGGDMDPDNDNMTANYALEYDEDLPGPGNLTDDGKDYTYVYDAWGRLKEVHNRSGGALVEEYVYNGLGMKTGWHYDVNASGTVDSSDVWYFSIYDDKWRSVATYRESSSTLDTYAKEIFIHHDAGLDGSGGSSYIDAAVLKKLDNTNGWSGAADGTLEITHYFCQDWRGDVSVVLLPNATTNSGDVVARQKYSSFGCPFTMPGGDSDCDGDLDGTDQTEINDGDAYQVIQDVDLDGDNDASDVTRAGAAVTLGWGLLGRSENRVRKGYAGYELDPALAGTKYHARYRVLDAELGRWLHRDPQGYSDGMNLYAYISDMAVSAADPWGLCGGLTGTDCFDGPGGGRRPVPGGGSGWMPPGGGNPGQGPVGMMVPAPGGSDPRGGGNPGSGPVGMIMPTPTPPEPSGSGTPAVGMMVPAPGGPFDQSGGSLGPPVCCGATCPSPDGMGPNPADACALRPGGGSGGGTGGSSGGNHGAAAGTVNYTLTYATSGYHRKFYTNTDFGRCVEEYSGIDLLGEAGAFLGAVGGVAYSKVWAAGALVGVEGAVEVGVAESTVVAAWGEVIHTTTAVGYLAYPGEALGATVGSGFGALMLIPIGHFTGTLIGCGISVAMD